MKIRTIFGLSVAICLFCLSTHLPQLWFLSLVCFLPVLWSLDHNEASLGSFVTCSWLFGTAFCGSVVWWYWSTLPLDWAGIENPTHGYLVITYVWSLSAFVPAIPIVCWALVSSWTHTRTVFDIVLLPALWVLCEFLRAQTISLLWSGPDSLNGPHWSLGFLGYALAGNEQTLQIASLGGVYLLSFVVVAINVAIYQLLTAETAKARASALLAGSCLCATVFAAAHLLDKASKFAADDKRMHLALVGTMQASTLRTDMRKALKAYSRQKRLVKEIREQAPQVDLLIFPEGIGLYSRLLAFGREDFITSELGDKERLFIDSGNEITADNRMLSSYYYVNTSSGDVEHSKKLFLIPHGEHIPWITEKLARSFGFSDWLHRFNTYRRRARGATAELATFGEQRIGGLFCGEILSPELYRDLTAQGATLLLNVASHGMFHGSEMLFQQILNTAKVRAAESGRFFIHAGNMVPSFVIDDRGRTLSISKKKDYSVSFVDVTGRSHRTPYVSYGDWILLLSLLVAVASATRSLLRRRQTETP